MTNANLASLRADTIQEVQDVAHTAKDQVIDLRDTARSRLEGEVDRRRNELGNVTRRFAGSQTR